MATRTRALRSEYAAITGTFAAGLAGVGLLARALGRDAVEYRPIDLVVLGTATFKAARTISRDRFASNATGIFRSRAGCIASNAGSSPLA